MGRRSQKTRVFRFWKRCRNKALVGNLSHAKAIRLVELAAAAGQWSQLRRWLPHLLRSGVCLGERAGSAIAIAAWLRKQQRLKLAMLCLEEVPWEQADADAWLLRGEIEHSLERFVDAQISLARAMTKASLQVVVSYRLGELHRSLGQSDQAAGWFLASLMRDPGYFFSHNSLQYTHFSAALLPRVISQYEEMVKKVPGYALPQQLLALYLLKAGRREDAITVARSASRLELGSREGALADGAVAPLPPDVVIIGVPKAGTTSLLRCLSHHPLIWCHPRKELHFFDQDFHFGEEWYRAQFPVFRKEAGILRAESTPNYFSHPLAASRMAALMPKGKCVLLLRDPIERAISWIRHLQRLQGLSADVESLLRRELTAMADLEPHELFAQDQVFTRGLLDSCYDQPLDRWLQNFPAEQVLLVSSEKLFCNPEQELAAVLAFLGLPEDVSALMPNWRPLNVNPRPAISISADLRSALESFFRRHSEGSLSRFQDQAVPLF